MEAMIREAIAADAQAVAPLIAQFRVELRALKGIASKPDLIAAEQEFKEYIDAGFPIDLCEVDGRIAGYAVCRVDAPVVWLESLFVDEEFRRRGIAGALFARAEALAKSYGEEMVYNWVHPNNHAMIAFLAKRGYDVLNLVEVRKPHSGEAIHTTIRVGEHEFRY